jgi:squalene cyclase
MLHVLSNYKNISASEQFIITKGMNNLIQAQLTDGGWPYDGISVLSTSDYVIMSLLKAGLSKDSPTITKGLSYLNSNQNPDGGFGGSGLTAQAAIIYKLAGLSYQAKLNQTIAWLKTNQNPDGGWGTTLGYTSTTSNTSWALIALSYAGESGIEVARGASWPQPPRTRTRGGSAYDTGKLNEENTAMAVGRYLLQNILWALTLKQSPKNKTTAQVKQ